VSYYTENQTPDKAGSVMEVLKKMGSNAPSAVSGVSSNNPMVDKNAVLKAEKGYEAEKTAAIKEMETTIENAKAKCQQAIDAARKKILAALTENMTLATKAGDLDLAIAIRDRKKSLEGETGAVKLPLENSPDNRQTTALEQTNSRIYNIVYVVQRSGSMMETLDYAKAETIRSINSLQPDQNFHVIYFASGMPVENPPKKLIPATDTNKRQAADFLRDVVPEGQTNPNKAFERAFQVTNDKGEKVQLIYMLSNGNFPSECVAFVRKLNPDKKVKINTICFIAPAVEGQPLLEAIAKDSGGKYRFVTQDELGK
jgi:hypothetical protein